MPLWLFYKCLLISFPGVDAMVFSVLTTPMLRFDHLTAICVDCLLPSFPLVIPSRWGSQKQNEWFDQFDPKATTRGSQLVTTPMKHMLMLVHCTSFVASKIQKSSKVQDHIPNCRRLLWPPKKTGPPAASAALRTGCHVLCRLPFSHLCWEPQIGAKVTPWRLSHNCVKMGYIANYHILVGDDYDDSHHLADLRVQYPILRRTQMKEILVFGVSKMKS